MAGINLASGGGGNDIAAAAQAGQIAAQGWAQLNNGFKQLQQSFQFSQNFKEQQRQFDDAQALSEKQFNLAYNRQVFEFDKNFQLAFQRLKLDKESFAFNKEQHTEQVRQWTEMENRLRATLDLDTSIFDEAKRVKHAGDISGFIFDTFGNIRDAARDEFGSRMVSSLLKLQGWGEEDAENFTVMAAKYYTPGDIKRADWLNGIEHPEIFTDIMQNRINTNVETSHAATIAESFVAPEKGEPEATSGVPDRTGKTVPGKSEHLYEPYSGEGDDIKNIEALPFSPMAGPGGGGSQGGTLREALNPVNVFEHIMSPTKMLMDDHLPDDPNDPVWGLIYAEDPDQLRFHASEQSVPFAFRNSNNYVSHDNPAGAAAAFESRRAAAAEALTNIEAMGDEDFERVFGVAKPDEDLFTSSGVPKIQEGVGMGEQKEVHFSIPERQPIVEPKILNAEEGVPREDDPMAVLGERARAQAEEEANAPAPEEDTSGFTPAQQEQLDAASGSTEPTDYERELKRIRDLSSGKGEREDYSNIAPDDVATVRERQKFTQRKSKGMRAPVVTPSGLPLDAATFFSPDGTGREGIEERAKETGAKPSEVKAITAQAVTSEVIHRLGEAVTSGTYTPNILRSLPDEVMADGGVTDSYMAVATAGMVSTMKDGFGPATTIEATKRRILQGYYAVGNDPTRGLTTYGLTDAEKGIIENASQFRDNRAAFEASVESQIKANALLNQHKGQEVALNDLFAILKPTISSPEFMEDPASFLNKPFFRGLYNEYRTLSSTISGIPVEISDMSYKRWALAIPAHFNVVVGAVGSQIATYQAMVDGEDTIQDGLATELETMAEQYSQ